jgi:AraC-like DNA-binding protein
MELSFELAPAKAQVASKVHSRVGSDDIFSLGNCVLTTESSAGGALNLSPDGIAIIHVSKGAFLLRGREQTPVTVVPRGATIIVTGGRHTIKAVEGETKLDWIGWSKEQFSPILPHFEDSPVASVLGLDEPLFDLGGQRNPTFSVRLGARVLSVVASVLERRDEIRFSTPPEGVPDAILRLLDEVRKHPEAYWPLPEASRISGYSTTHFSRIFRSAVGYGFQSFVERCRTEAAVKLLTTTHENVDNIAETCGFGATQTMRVALREHVGFVPSELRSL